MYTLRHVGYCGMSGLPDTFDDRAEARAAAADELRRHRGRGRAIAILTPGKAWEILEPEDSLMVPDWAGVLRLTRKVFECRECGCQHETGESAADCCCLDCGEDDE